MNFFQRKLPFTTLIIRVLILTITFNSCKKTEPGPDRADANKIVSISLTVDKNSLVANNQDMVIFVVTAKNASNQNVNTSGIEIYVNGNKNADATFSTGVAGRYMVYAKWNEISSNNIELTALTPEDARVIDPKANTQLILADGKSTIRFAPTLTDEFGVTHTLKEPDWTLYVNGTESPNRTFTTTSPGTYNLTIKSGVTTSQRLEIVARNAIDYDLVTIPIVFHIAHYGEAVGEGLNLSRSRVEEVLETVNRLFANEGGSDNPNAVDMRIRFRLATIGPEGQVLEEAGITRYDISKFDDGYSASVPDVANDKLLGANERTRVAMETTWDPNQYLNIWVTPVESANGWARLPVLYTSYPLPGLGTTLDNCGDCIETWVPYIYVHNNAFTGGSQTTAHEIGHALGLRHVFSENNCQTSDYCPDTYSYNKANSAACPDNRGLLVRDNIMDHQGSGMVRNTFTYDQRERVWHVLQHGHWVSNLTSSDR